ncbi:hypothetical protein AGMMS50230_09650 [Spirochaetia bacterium]|nr:hypothetical protein AGMMS50230_09650 [Spirochaetia bacterium]
MYPFTLRFEKNHARFPFIVDGKPLTGSAVPSCVISGRAAGNMALTNIPARESFFRSLGIPPEQVYSLHQVHSRDVFTLGEAGKTALSAADLPDPAAFVRDGDGLVSPFSPHRQGAPSPFLAVTVADCLPVFLFDTEKEFFAALHSGWKGTGIVLRALAILKAWGTRPEAVAAVLGPCIQSCCYQVDEERAKAFEGEFGESAVVRRDGKVFLSLQAANARLLKAAGLRHIACCKNCTFEDERLGSFRREGPQSYTRMIAMTGYLATGCLAD